MRKFFLGMVALLGLSLTTQLQAQSPDYPPIAGCGSCQPGVGSACGTCGDSSCGWAPAIRNLFKSRLGRCGACGTRGIIRSSLCNTCSQNSGPAFGPRLRGPQFNPYPEGMPGTLVFPYSQYVRSPRDFFMHGK